MSDVAERQPKELLALRQIQQMETAIRALPNALLAENGDNEFIQTAHFFGPGTYVRQCTRKKGVVLVGARHREACVAILLKGKLAIASSTSDVDDVVEAPAVWVTKPGTKRATYALEDSIFITVHPNPTNTTDLTELEAAIIIGDDE